MSACIELHFVNAADKMEVSPPFSEFFCNNIRRKLRVINVDVELAERGARRRADDPCWLIGPDKVHGEAPIRGFVEVPWGAVGLCSPEVKSCKPINVQITSAPMGRF